MYYLGIDFQKVNIKRVLKSIKLLCILNALIVVSIFLPWAKLSNENLSLFNIARLEVSVFNIGLSNNMLLFTAIISIIVLVIVSTIMFFIKKKQIGIIMCAIEGLISFCICIRFIDIFSKVKSGLGGLGGLGRLGGFINIKWGAGCFICFIASLIVIASVIINLISIYSKQQSNDNDFDNENRMKGKFDLHNLMNREFGKEQYIVMTMAVVAFASMIIVHIRRNFNLDEFIVVLALMALSALLILKVDLKISDEKRQSIKVLRSALEKVTDGLKRLDSFLVLFIFGYGAINVMQRYMYSSLVGAIAQIWLIVFWISIIRAFAKNENKLIVEGLIMRAVIAVYFVVKTTFAQYPYVGTKSLVEMFFCAIIAMFFVKNFVSNRNCVNLDK